MRLRDLQFQHELVVVTESKDAGLVSRGEDFSADFFQPCGDGFSIEGPDFDAKVFDTR
jgi:hypothetical protein